MNTVSGWIKKHQVAAFFIITFTITWGLGFSYDAVINKGNFLLVPLVMIATCGPALAGILVTAICSPRPKQRAGQAYWIALFAAWIVSAIVFLANNKFINHASLSIVMVGFTIICVPPVAFVISMAHSRVPAVKHYQWFFFNATGEEVGWRGFALPRMQAVISPLAACLVINLFWPLWHLFLWEAEGRAVFSLGYWGQTYLELLPASVALIWIYNRSKGSILAAGIGHAAANTAFAFFPNLDWVVFVWTSAAAALVMILIDQMWKKLPHDHPAVYHDLEPDGQTGTAPVPIPTHA